MNDSAARLEGLQPLTAREAALADIEERRRRDPNWNPSTDPTYSGPYPTFVQLMTDAEYDRHMAAVQERRQSEANLYAPGATEYIEPQPVPRRMFRAVLPLGQRIRDVRRSLGWTQCDIAPHLGVSTRTIIRYERGHSAPLQSATLLALRRLEAHASEQVAVTRKSIIRERE